MRSGGGYCASVPMTAKTSYVNNTRPDRLLFMRWREAIERKETVMSWEEEGRDSAMLLKRLK